MCFLGGWWVAKVRGYTHKGGHQEGSLSPGAWVADNVIDVAGTAALLGVSELRVGETAPGGNGGKRRVLYDAGKYGLKAVVWQRCSQA